MELTHTSCTIEKLNLREEYDIAVIDEIQMISDSQRGGSMDKSFIRFKM